MLFENIDRRKFLQIGFLLGVSGLSGCGSKKIDSPILISTKETLPRELLRSLPPQWKFQTLELASDLKESKKDFEFKSDLIAIGDGWLTSFNPENLRTINIQKFSPYFDKQVNNFIGNLEKGFVNKVLPIGVSPWVMIFRNGKEWLPEAKKDWSVLLNKRLKGQIVFPNSPRLIISIAEKLKTSNGLSKLRSQALTYDDRNALNWLLSGKARVAVLPLDRCFGKLKSDPRLSVALPNSGAPLNLIVLVRPKSSIEPFPYKWFNTSCELPLLGKLISEGWIPPLKHSQLMVAIDFIPEKYKSIVLPSQDVWDRCWTLPPLNIAEQKLLETNWIKSAP